MEILQKFQWSLKVFKKKKEIYILIYLVYNTR